ncbi:MAG: phenylalanine--tRNA ligase subunit beta, partial [Deltaproteobacteria bacterium]|nr:phenylalanine--tRNA ligase subunit beta [Deltaproteobacteria bacterium]
MKLSLNWVRDFITLDENLQNKELIETITLSVCEVEGFEETGRHLKDIITAQVLSIKPHPNAEKLTLVTIDLGHRQLEIVCGASNFKPSDKVAYAGLGVCLPDGTKIKKAKIRGIESEGMLLAEDELGFSEDHEGVMILPPKANLGETLDQIYPDQVDVIMEIDNKSITHRPDLWGHYGFAREFGTIYKTPIKSLPSKPEDIRGEGKALIDVEVICKDYVPRFSGLSIENLEARPSPDWIRYRLNRVGLRPINNLVDITNYVMLELGQPMHAFDAAQIKGQKLIVRLAKNGDRVMTLHKKEVDLTDEDMTICDTNGASVVAGVVGGVNSGVTENSTAIFLEAANWNPVLIRKTSTRIGLRTDASQRYEKGLDPELTVFAIARATDLLRLSNPELKIRGGLVDIFGKKIDPVTVETSLNFIRERLGKNIASNEILGILERLGFRITRKEPKLVVEVPTYRRTGDVSIPEDLVEEIGRIHGFNHIAPLAPQFPIERPIFNQQRLFERKIRNGLAQSGFHEVLSYPLSSSKLEERFDLDQSQMLRIINPVSDHQEQMRTSMLPHFADCVYKNQKIAFDFSVFEIGRIYQRSKMGENSEPHRLILAVSKTKQNLGDSFYELKSKMSYLFSKLM